MQNEICVIRMGGLGDLAILSSSLLALKRKIPWRPLVLATLEHNLPLLQGAAYLDRVTTVGQAEQEDWFKVYDCRWGVEPPNIGPGRTSWENYTGMDRSDIFDSLLGVQGQKEFSIPVDPASLKKMKGVLGKKQLMRVGIAPTSRSPVRCMPPEYIRPLASLVRDMGVEVILFGKTEPWSESLHGAACPGINLLDLLTVKEMVALVDLCDVVISPDTAIYHVAAARQKKTLAIFGNIPPHTRTLYYPTVTALFPSKAEAPCNTFPCWDVPNTCQRVPNVFGAPCMRLFTPERIMDNLYPLLGYQPVMRVAV